MKAESPRYDPDHHDEDQRGSRFYQGKRYAGTVVAQSDAGVFVTMHSRWNVASWDVHYYVTVKKAATSQS